MKLSSVINIHRALGVFCFPFMMLMATTGILLNHTDDLNLSNKDITWGWLMSWYDIKKPEQLIAYDNKNLSITQIDQKIFFNKKEVFKKKQKLLGTIFQDEIHYLLFEAEVSLLTENGELIEAIKMHHGLPSSLISIGASKDQKIYLRSTQSNYLCDFDNLKFIKSEDSDIHWSKESKPLSEISNQLIYEYNGKGISIHKLITDLHNGFFFTSYGKAFLDIVGLLFISLSCTGLWIYFKKPKSKPSTTQS